MHRAQWLQLGLTSPQLCCLLAKRVGHLAGQLDRADMQLHSAQEAMFECVPVVALLLRPSQGEEIVG